MKIVLDTNVLVSAMLNEQGTPARVVALVTSGRAQLLVSRAILQEYDRVLAYADFGFTAEQRESLRVELAEESEQVSAEDVTLELPDPDDTEFLAVAIAGRADYLVTGNKRHFPPLKSQGVRVLSPAEFIAAMPQDEG